MDNESFNTPSHIFDITANAHLDFKLNDWSAAAVLITSCLSIVIIYGIKTWEDVTSTHLANLID